MFYGMKAAVLLGRMLFRIDNCSQLPAAIYDRYDGKEYIGREPQTL